MSGGPKKMYKLHRENHSRSKIEDGLIYRGLTVNFKVQINDLFVCFCLIGFFTSH